MGEITRVPKSLILPAPGGGQAYAERTSSTGQIGVGDGATATDISGLTISPVPDSTQMLVVLYCPRIDKSSTAGWVSIQVTDTAGGGTIYNSALQSIAASSFAPMTCFALITGLTPGTAKPLKAQMATSASTAAIFAASSSARPFLVALRA